MRKDQTLLLEVGAAGYDNWQLTDDTGSDASNPDVHDEVHGVGLQIGLTFVSEVLTLNFLGCYEFAAENRFQARPLA